MYVDRITAQLSLIMGGKVNRPWPIFVEHEKGKITNEK